MQRILSLLSAFCVLFAGAALPASAAEAAEATLTVTVKNGPTTVVIEAVDDAPLPDETEIEVEDSADFVLKYNTPGIYQYSISQKPGAREDVIYDETVYNVTVYVVSDDSGDLSTSIVAVKEGSETKMGELGFVNEVVPPVTVVATKVWDDRDNADGLRDEVVLTLQRSEG